MRFSLVFDHESHQHSRSFAQAVVDLGVSYGEDVDEVMELMRVVGGNTMEDSEILQRRM